MSPTANTPRDCLSRQSSDLLQHMFTYLLSSTKIQLWGTCKRFHNIISNLVPITFTISYVEEGLRLIPLFKKVQFKINDDYYFNDNNIVQLDKYIVSFTFSTRYISVFNTDNKITVTNKGLKHLTNLTYLDIGFNEFIGNEGIKPLTGMRQLCINRNNRITDEGIKDMKDLRKLTAKNVPNVTDNGIKHLTKLKVLRLDVDCVNFEYKEILRKRGVKVCH